ALEHHRLETWWYIMLCPQYVRYRRCRNLPEVEITRRRYLRGHAGFRYPRRIQRFAPSCRQYLTALWKLESLRAYHGYALYIVRHYYVVGRRAATGRDSRSPHLTDGHCPDRK